MEFASAVLQYVLIFSTAVWFVGLLIYRQFLKTPTPDRSPQWAPKVSILKIFCGMDEALVENLESFCHIDYPNYEIILSVLDPDDPVVPILKQFAEKHPEKAIRLIVNPCRIGYNLQVCNFHNALQEAAGEVVIFSDSDTRATPDYIRQLIRPLSDPRVGIVSGLPFIANPKGFVGNMKAIAYNITIPGMDIMWRAFTPMAIGPAMAMRRETLEKSGGLKPISNKLTTDQELAKLVHSSGYRTRLVPYRVRIWEAPQTASTHRAQMIRWLIALRSVVPAEYSLFPLGLPVLVAFLFWLTAPLNWVHFTAFGFTLLWRTLVPLWVYGSFYGEPVPKRYSWTFALSDFFLIPLWARGFLVQTIQWRNTEFLLVKGELKTREAPIGGLSDESSPITSL